MIFRPVVVGDYRGIASCLERNNMSIPSESEWLRTWDEHPYAHDFNQVPRGFVLESDGAIVGTIFNLWAKYWLRGRVLKVAISGSAAVDPEHRSGSIKLMGETVRQPHVDLYLNGSPSEVAARIMDTLKVRRVPQPDYDVSLLWPVRGSDVALAGLRRRRVPLASVLAWPAGLAMRTVSRVKALSLRGAECPVVIRESFADEFDELWEALRAQSTRLLGFRDQAMLRWRYSKLLAQGDAVVLLAHRDQAPVGYAVLVRMTRPRLGLEQFLIHDIQCVNDDPDVTRALLSRALKETRRNRLDLLEWVGHAGASRRIAERATGFRYQLNVWQAYYYTRDPELKQALASSDHWGFGPYDSD
jgi:hypothetical protein